MPPHRPSTQTTLTAPGGGYRYKVHWSHVAMASAILLVLALLLPRLLAPAKAEQRPQERVFAETAAPQTAPADDGLVERRMRAATARRAAARKAAARKRQALALRRSRAATRQKAAAPLPYTGLPTVLIALAGAGFVIAGALVLRQEAWILGELGEYRRVHVRIPGTGYRLRLRVPTRGRTYCCDACLHGSLRSRRQHAIALRASVS